MAKRRKRLFALLDPLTCPPGPGVPLSCLTLPSNRFRRIELAFQQNAAGQLAPRPLFPGGMAAAAEQGLETPVHGLLLAAGDPGAPALRFEPAAAPALPVLLPEAPLQPMLSPTALRWTTATPVAAGAAAACPALRTAPSVLEPVHGREILPAAAAPDAPPMFDRLARLRTPAALAPQAPALLKPGHQPEWISGVQPAIAFTAPVPGDLGLAKPSPALCLPQVQSFMPAPALLPPAWNVPAELPVCAWRPQPLTEAPQAGLVVSVSGLPAPGPLLKVLEIAAAPAFAPVLRPPAMAAAREEMVVRAGDLAQLALPATGVSLTARVHAAPVTYLAAERAPFRPAACAAVEQVRFDSVACEVPPAVAVRIVEEDPAAPALHNRMLPVHAPRPLQGRPVWTPEADRQRLPLWSGAFEAEPQICHSGLCLDQADGSGPTRLPEPKKPRFQLPSFRLPRLPRLGGAWRHAPADLKWVSLAIPAVLVLVIYSLMPSPPMKPAGVTVTETAGETASAAPSALAERFSTMQKVIMERAAIRLIDDFRSGLGAWSGPDGWSKTWQYNAANFVSPGRLAIYSPTARMQDYEFSFLAQIDRRSLNWVVRAADEKNHHVIRIVITQPGPLPKAMIVRYPVINGRQGPATTLPLPLTIRTDTLYKVRMEVKGDRFITYVQDQVVDSFTDDRLPQGGVGFFSPQGDRALLRWVSVMHQYDYLGRLCAVLAPYTARAEGRRME